MTAQLACQDVAPIVDFRELPGVLAVTFSRNGSNVTVSVDEAHARAFLAALHDATAAAIDRRTLAALEAK